MPLVLILLAALVALVAGAIAAMAARIQDGSRGVLFYVFTPLLALLSLAVFWGAVEVLAGLAALTFATGAYVGGFTARPLLARLRLVKPTVRYSNWS